MQRSCILSTVIAKKKNMKYPIEILKDEAANFGPCEELYELQSAIKILQIHNKDQEPQVPKKLDAEGVNGLINALHSLRLAGVKEIEIVNKGDYVVFKRLKR